jgi:hypothetical protein
VSVELGVAWNGGAKWRLRARVWACLRERGGERKKREEGVSWRWQKASYSQRRRRRSSWRDDGEAVASGGQNVDSELLACPEEDDDGMGMGWASSRLR